MTYVSHADRETACAITRQFENDRAHEAWMLAKKPTIAILPSDQKLTEDMTKWDSAQKIWTANTAQCKLRNVQHVKKALGRVHVRENDHESIKPLGDKPQKG